MNCQSLTHDLLLDYADNKLTSKEAQGTKHHLAQCQPCKRRLNEVTLISSAVQTSPAMRFSKPIAPDMDVAVLAEIKTAGLRIRNRSRTIPWRVAMPYAAAAAIAIVAVVVLQYLQTHPIRSETAIVYHPVSSTEKRTEVAKETPITPAEDGSQPVVARKILGDVNGDGVVNIADAMLLSRALAGETTLDVTLANGDFNGDHRVDIADVRAISMLTVTDKE